MCIIYQEYTSQLKQKPPKDVLTGVFLSLDSKASGIWMELHFSPKRKGRSDILHVTQKSKMICSDNGHVRFKSHRVLLSLGL